MARFITFTPKLAAAAAALILAAGASAQSDRRPDRPPPPPGGGGGGGDRPALRGPRVGDDRAPGTDNGFVPGGGGGDRKMMGERIPPRAFLDALHSLGDDNLPPGVRATPEQMDKLTAITEGFRAQREDYMRKNGEELRKLRQDAGIGPGRGGPGGDRPGGQGGPGGPGAGGPGGPGAGGPPNGDRPGPRGGGRAGPGRPDGQGGPGGGGPGGDRPGDDMGAGNPDPAKREAARARIREIEQGAPKIEDVYTKAWAELNDAQKKYIDGKLDQERQRGAKDREDAYVRQKVGQRPGGGAGGPPGPGGPDARRDAAPDNGALRERRDRLIKIFEQLPPEEQDRLLSRLEQRLAGRGGAGGDDRPAPPPDGARPAPRRGGGGGRGGDNPPPPPPPPGGGGGGNPR